MQVKKLEQLMKGDDKICTEYVRGCIMTYMYYINTIPSFIAG